MSLICSEKSGILEVYKPIMMPTTPGLSPQDLTSQILEKYPKLGTIQGFQPNEGGLLYRLDNETSGLVLFATQQVLFDQFSRDTKAKRVKKHYLAYVKGILTQRKAKITFPIAHHPKSSKRMIVQKELNQQKRSEWRSAETYYQVLQEDHKGNSWLHVIIYQGARHQIRIHCAAIGHPLIGDKLYHAQKDTNEQMLLRCQAIEWTTKHQIFNLTDLPLTTEEKGIFPALESLTIAEGSGSVQLLQNI